MSKSFEIITNSSTHELMTKILEHIQKLITFCNILKSGNLIVTVLLVRVTDNQINEFQMLDKINVEL